MVRPIIAAAAALLLASCAAPLTDTAPTAQTVSLPLAPAPADALLFLPPGRGPAPAVIVWTDNAGLRPAYRALGERIAAAGFVVLIPNSFHRSVDLDGSAPAPALDGDAVRERATAWRTALTEDAVKADTAALVAWLEAQPRVDRTRKIGVLGLDYGSSHAFVAARSLPDRIGAVAALYPSGTATPRPTSPHLFVSQSKAAYLVVLARNDDVREPGDKEDFRKAFTEAQLAWQLEVAPADHGFAVADEPAFDAAQADRALAQAIDLFRTTLR